jgi:hypothetical protein
MVRAAQREADTYDRNREALFDLRRADVRAQIHTLLIRLTLALDGVLAASEAIVEADLALKSTDSDLAKAAYQARIDSNVADRAGSFDYAVELGVEIPALLKALNRTAHYSFEAHERVVRRAQGFG